MKLRVVARVRRAHEPEAEQREEHERAAAELLDHVGFELRGDLDLHHGWWWGGFLGWLGTRSVMQQQRARLQSSKRGLLGCAVCCPAVIYGSGAAQMIS